MTKSELQEAVEVFGAASEPTRLRLLKCLQLRPARVGELVWSLGLPQPTVSRHLRVLHRAGLVVAERQAQWVQYALAPDAEGAVRMAILWAVSRALDGDPQVAADRERLKEITQNWGEAADGSK